nr:HAD-IB family phosphatase [Succinivibrionaceae bacterium]
MPCAFFDMDDTLIDADTNEIFFNFLHGRGLVGDAFLEPLGEFQRRFYEGTLSIDDFVRYAISPLVGMPRQGREALVGECVRELILPRAFPGALRAVRAHLAAGDEVFVVSATADYIVDEVARGLGIAHAIAAP